MTKYTRKVTSNGVTQYRDVTKNVIVKGEDLPAAIKEELDLGAEGEVLDSEGITNDHSTQEDGQGNEVQPNKPAAPTTEDNSEVTAVPAPTSAQEAQEAAVGPDASRDDKLPEEKPEELSDADKELAASPELNGTFTPEEPKAKKLPKMDDGKKLPQALNTNGQPVAEPTEKGFGFPRRNGKTGDIFDFDTPHTAVKFVDGFTVPLSDKSYQEKSEYEIHQRLVDLGYVSDEGVRLV